MHNVQWTRRGHSSSRRRYTAAQKDGLAFEDEVCTLFPLGLGSDWHHVRGPWISYMQSERPRLAQPDLLLVNFRLGLVIIVEIKLRHTHRSISQIKKYLRLVKQLFPQPHWKVRAVELYKYHDVIEYPGTQLSLEWKKKYFNAPINHAPWMGKAPELPA